MNASQYSKAIASIIGATLTAVITYYPHASWLPIVTAVLTGLSVYAVPNSASQANNASQAKSVSAVDKP